MATETIQVTYDDIDQTHPAESHTFTFEGQTYSIDLGAHNLQRMREALAPFIKHARKGPARKPAAGDASDRAYRRAVRAWAAANGVPVPERGKLPAEVQDAYNKAHLERLNLERRNGRPVVKSA